MDWYGDDWKKRLRWNETDVVFRDMIHNRVSNLPTALFLSGRAVGWE